MTQATPLLTGLTGQGHCALGSSIDFELPDELQAGEPPEARGLKRDEVRLLVSNLASSHIVHTQFRELARFLRAGDVLAINTSGTMNAALKAYRDDGSAVELHLSTRLPADLWVVEVRKFAAVATKPMFDGKAGEWLALPAGGRAHLLAPHHASQRDERNAKVRLWIATLTLPLPIGDYLTLHGSPIRYGYVRRSWPGHYYQTTYATEVGSAEMPSAGRAFTPQLLTTLVAKGVQIAPLILHTGVASVEDHEPPYEEYYRVPLTTAQMINRARIDGRRIIAVGTTVIRAIETVADKSGLVHAGAGWTDLVITPQRGLRAIDGLLTGLHEPRATHLAMLEALAGACHIQIAYQAAVDNHYLWHEFGDLHLLVP